jgi:hypothetical protein
MQNKVTWKEGYFRHMITKGTRWWNYAQVLAGCQLGRDISCRLALGIHSIHPVQCQWSFVPVYQLNLKLAKGSGPAMKLC